MTLLIFFVLNILFYNTQKCRLDLLTSIILRQIRHNFQQYKLQRLTYVQSQFYEQYDYNKNMDYTVEYYSLNYENTGLL